jgi:hypothetical protein
VAVWPTRAKLIGGSVAQLVVAGSNSSTPAEAAPLVPPTARTLPPAKVATAGCSVMPVGSGGELHTPAVRS